MARKGIKLELPKPIKGKLYKNSECDKCGCYLCLVKEKNINGDKMIICKECFNELSSKN